jgi:hypothetical protein
MKPVVLILSTYPFVQPRHGGQVRLSNIAATFESVGWQVESIAVYEPEGYRSHEVKINDLAFPLDSGFRLFNGRAIPLINDFLSAEYATADSDGFPFIKRALPKRIDAIHVEQPWLWRLAAKIKKIEGYENTVLIFGSQNIEAPLKREILLSYSVREIDDVIEAIDALEHQAAQEADLTLAVTQADLNVLVGYGAKNCKLASNGIAPWCSSELLLTKWRRRLPMSNEWLLYVASAHPPNFQGFTKCFGDSLGCLPPDSKLVVVGSVCNHLYAALRDTRWGSLNLSRLQLLGELESDDLSAVKTLAPAFLLPILHGGGSNIKTAEALYSGAIVFGSEAAFRGFESFKSLPEVYVARSPAEFQIAIREHIKPMKQISKKKVNKTIRDELKWSSTLALIPEMVSRIASPKS